MNPVVINELAIARGRELRANAESWRRAQGIRRIRRLRGKGKPVGGLS